MLDNSAAISAAARAYRRLTDAPSVVFPNGNAVEIKPMTREAKTMLADPTTPALTTVNKRIPRTSQILMFSESFRK